MVQVIKREQVSESGSDVEDIVNTDEEESETEEDDMNIPSLINHFFTNEEGKNIAEILTDFKKSLDTHNKLIYKLLAAQSQKK